jgi:hypothetical protein
VNPAVENQATDRAFRIGQTQPAGPRADLPRHARGARRRTAHLQTALAEQAVGSGEDWLTELSTEALRDLLVLRATRSIYERRPMRTAVLDVDTLEALLADFEREEPELGTTSASRPICSCWLSAGPRSTPGRRPRCTTSAAGAGRGVSLLRGRAAAGREAAGDVLRTQTALGRA